MRYFLQINGRSAGPFTVEEVEDLHGAGKVNRSTPCRTEDRTDWSTVYNMVPTAVWVTRERVPAPQLPTEPRKTRPKRIYLWVGLSFALFLAILIPLVEIATTAGENRDVEIRRAAAHARTAPPGLPGLSGFPLTPQNPSQVNTLNGDPLPALAGALFLLLMTPVIFFGVAIILFAFWLWMLISVVTMEPEGNDKIVWTLVVIFTGPLGAAIYFFARFIKRNRTPV